MSTPSWLLLFDAAVVGLCHVLPRTRFGAPARALLFVLAGFLLAQSALSAAIAGLGLAPNGPFQDLVQRQTGYADGRPVVLVIGSSFSEHGIDADVLAERLGDTGRAPLVQRLAVGGAPHIERLYYLKQYLARAATKPQLVLFEVAGGYDGNPLYQIHQMRYSDRMVAMMDGSSAWWGFRWLAAADRLDVWQRLRLGSEIVGQWALHMSHIGYLWNIAEAGSAANGDGSPPPAPISDTDTAKLLRQAIAAEDLRPDWPAEVPSRWMSAFLAEEIALLRSYGVQHFAFYSVPSMQGADVAYARRFCAAMRQFPCFVGEEPQLVDALEYGADWYDFDHLQGSGRTLFTRWLADRVVGAGVWP